MLSKAKYSDKDVERFKVELQNCYQLDPDMVQNFIDAKFDVLDCRNSTVEQYVSTVKRRIRENIQSIILNTEVFTQKFCAYSGISSVQSVKDNIKATLTNMLPQIQIVDIPTDQGPYVDAILGLIERDKVSMSLRLLI